MMEMADTGCYHGKAKIVGGDNRIVIANLAAGMYNSLDAGCGSNFDTIVEREECI